MPFGDPPYMTFNFTTKNFVIEIFVVVVIVIWCLSRFLNQFIRDFYFRVTSHRVGSLRSKILKPTHILDIKFDKN